MFYRPVRHFSSFKRHRLMRRWAGTRSAKQFRVRACANQFCPAYRATLHALPRHGKTPVLSRTRAIARRRWHDSIAPYPWASRVFASLCHALRPRCCSRHHFVCHARSVKPHAVRCLGRRDGSPPATKNKPMTLRGNGPCVERDWPLLCAGAGKWTRWRRCRL
jgi:hypothetical protein